MAGFSKKNVEQVQRNGKPKESKTIIRYVTQIGKDGENGEDTYSVFLSPNNKTFTAGAFNAENQTHYVNVYAYRGANQIDALVLDSSITGVHQGALDVSVQAGTNGTNHTTLIIDVTDELSADAGVINIPVQYNINSLDSSTEYIASEWEAGNALVTFNAIFSWTLGKTGESMYVLDLSNETATINCSSTGHVISTAVRPPCQATLSFGANDELSGVYYDASWEMPGVTGIGINHQTGEVLYDSSAHAHDSNFPSGNFDFGDASTNTILNLTIDASYDGRVRGRKVMTIEKALPGQQGPRGYTPYIGENGNWWINGEDTGVKAEGDNGDDAVSRWIDLSADQVKIDSSGNILPPTITASIWKQVGGNTPEEETDTSWNIKWFPDSSTERAYSSAVTVLSSWNYMTFKLYLGNVYAGETETVPILKDGAPGAQGRRGAAIRGPVLWDSSSNVNVTGLAKRWFYCGTQTHFGPNPPARPEEAEFIDVIIHDGQYYVCTDNYEQAAGATWGSVYPNYWSPADASYEFVAANLILAKNAGIDFLTGNEIYLRDSSGNVTAGAAGGSKTSFWAGANSPTNAAFKVNYDGTMTATKGTFGCLEIGQDSAGRSVLTGEGTYDGTTTELTLSPTYFTMDASSNKVILSPGGNPNANGIIHIDSSADRIDMWADGIVRAGSLETMTTTAAGNVLPSGSIVNTYASGGGAVITPGLFNVEIVFVTNSILLTTSGGPFDKTGSTWKFHGIDTRVSTSSYPNIGIYNNPNGKYHGHIQFSNESSQTVVSGIAYTVATRQPNVIYITL